MKDLYNIGRLKIGSFGLAALFSLMFWIWLFIALSGCKVAERTTDLKKVHAESSSVKHLETESGARSDVHNQVIEKAGVLYILDKNRPKIQPGQSVDEYAAENSSEILDYTNKATTKDSTGKTFTKAALSSQDRAVSDTSIKKTDHKKDSSAGSLVKSVPWYAWLVAAGILGLLLYLKIK